MGNFHFALNFAKYFVSHFAKYFATYLVEYLGNIATSTRISRLVFPNKQVKLHTRVCILCKAYMQIPIARGHES